MFSSTLVCGRGYAEAFAMVVVACNSLAADGWMEGDVAVLAVKEGVVFSPACPHPNTCTCPHTYIHINLHIHTPHAHPSIILTPSRTPLLASSLPCVSCRSFRFRSLLKRLWQHALSSVKQMCRHMAAVHLVLRCRDLTQNTCRQSSLSDRSCFLTSVPHIRTGLLYAW